MKRIVIFTLFFSLVINSVVMGADCYRNWYRYSICSSCDDNDYNSSQTDSCLGKHPRQNGIKLCNNCLSNMSPVANYYKRGFSDYNCLAYALGKNGVQTWTWPTSWGNSGPTLSTFKSYIKAKGYTCTDSLTNAAGTNIIFVYASNGYVKHFARKYTLDGRAVAGAATISKWGACSLYTTKAIEPYTSSSSYGKLALICYK